MDDQLRLVVARRGLAQKMHSSMSFGVLHVLEAPRRPDPLIGHRRESTRCSRLSLRQRAPTITNLHSCGVLDPLGHERGAWSAPGEQPRRSRHAPLNRPSSEQTAAGLPARSVRQLSGGGPRWPRRRSIRSSRSLRRRRPARPAPPRGPSARDPGAVERCPRRSPARRRCSPSESELTLPSGRSSRRPFPAPDGRPVAAGGREHAGDRRDLDRLPGRSRRARAARPRFRVTPTCPRRVRRFASRRCSPAA